MNSVVRITAIPGENFPVRCGGSCSWTREKQQSLKTQVIYHTLKEKLK